MVFRIPSLGPVTVRRGGATAYGVLPNCQGADCPNYISVRGYVFAIPQNTEISLSFESVLTDEDVLSDLFALEYSDQMLPKTALTVERFKALV